MLNCKQCKASFEVTDQNRKFYEMVSPEFNGKKYLISDPTLCLDCRAQRRLAYRNERSLYHRKSDMSGKQIVTMYPPEAPYKVFAKEEWWGDMWDPRNFGREFDFSRSFFDQFAELMKEVPLPPLVVGDGENADYTNYTMSCRNSYLIDSSDYDEDCYYGSYLFKCQDCIDCLFVSDSTHLYECIDCKGCANSQFLQNCYNCSDCLFCYNLRNCQDCIGCVNLRGKKNCLFNEQLTKEEFAKKKKELKLAASNLKFIRDKFLSVKKKYPHKFTEIEDCINSTGDHLIRCKNCHNCFDLVEAEDCTNVSLGLKPKDCMDCAGVPNSEICYETVASPEDYAMRFCAVTWPRSDFLYYCLFCRMSKNCFGCVSTLKNEYCILNRQYIKEEYEKFVPQIIEHMKKTGEWGEFFPINLSPFAYNETVAQDYFPMEKEDVIKGGWKWHEENQAKSYKGPVYEVPDKIEDVADDITKQILICEATGKPYKMIPQELKFYREHGIPVPRQCPDERHRARMNLRNPRKLYDRKCDKCGAVIRTTYSPDRPEKVYCEKCYLEEVY